jgi:hypothetical protein
MKIFHLMNHIIVLYDLWYRYRPRTASPATFIWAFNKMMTKDEWKDEYRDDHVKIYAINITGMAGGIVNRCQFCGLGKTNKG